MYRFCKESRPNETLTHDSVEVPLKFRLSKLCFSSVPSGQLPERPGMESEREWELTFRKKLIIRVEVEGRQLELAFA